MNKKILKTYNLNGLDDSKNLAIDIASSGKKIICLDGDLGSGKTTLASFIIKLLLDDEIINVTSPTFNIVQIYNNSKCEVHHYDLYRLKSFEEALDIGIEESLENAICILEWPEIVSPLIRKEDTIYVKLELDSNNRIAVVN